jgi:glycosyltransferase involved in cell wall biosynthesis
MAKPSIAVVSTSFPKTIGDPNGNFVYELCLQLKNDFTVFVICPKFKAAESEAFLNGIYIRRHKQFVFDNIELAYGTSIMTKIKRNPLYILLVPFFFLFQFMELYKLCNKENIKVIHAHWLIPTAVGPILYKSWFNKGIKIVCTAHGTDVNSFNGALGNIVKKWILKRTDAITAVSQALAQNLKKTVPSSRILVYPMGVHTSIFSPEAKNEELTRTHKIEGPYILYVGEIISSKGVGFLIEAMPNVLKKFPKYSLVLVGQGIMENELKLSCQKLGIAENVVFTGAIPNIELPAFFASAELFVLPSLSEGWPVVVMEALSSGTMPLVTDLPVFVENEDRDRIFKIVKKGSPIELSDKIIEFLTNREDNSLISMELRNYAIRNFDWKIVGQNYSSLIQYLI